MVMPLSLSASAGGGGPSGSSSNAGVQTPISTPFNFDGSGWVINLGGSNTTNAGGNSDANRTDQTQTTPGALGGMLGGIDPMLIGLGVVVFLLLRQRQR
jgi:hypothetical protein